MSPMSLLGFRHFFPIDYMKCNGNSSENNGNSGRDGGKSLNGNSSEDNDNSDRDGGKSLNGNSSENNDNSDRDGGKSLNGNSSKNNANSGGDGGKSYMGIKSCIAGGISGGVQILITYPLEFLKTQIQLDEKGHGPQCGGSWDCSKKTYQRSGFHGFYRGMAITLCGCIPKAGVRFYVLELMRKAFEDSTGQFNTNMKLFSGLVAGAVEAIVAVTPSETMKVKFINDERSPNPQYRGLVHGIKTIIKTDGIRGTYQGLTPTILKEGTNQAIRYSVVESLKEIYTDGDSNKSVPIRWIALFGAIGGAVSVIFNNPLDVIKTRMQGLEAARYKNTWDCAKQIYRYESFNAFFKGTVPRMWRVSMDVAITFVVYDKLMEWFHKIL